MGRKKKEIIPNLEILIPADITIYYAIWWTAPEWIYNMRISKVKLENGKVGDSISLDDYLYFRNRFREVTAVYPYDKKKKFTNFLENSQKNPFF